VISQSKNLCHKVYGRRCADVSLDTGEVVAALTPPLYRPPCSADTLLRLS